VPFLTDLIERVDLGANQIDIRLRLGRLSALLDIAATPLPGATEGDTEVLSIPVRLRRSGREILMLIDGIDPFATVKPNARLIKLLIRSRRLNAMLVGSDGVPLTALAKREGVSLSYFTRLVRLSYLAPDIIQAILDGHQPRDLTPEKLLEHSRLPLAWHDQRTTLGFAWARSALGAFPDLAKYPEATRTRLADQWRHCPEPHRRTAVLEYRPTEILLPVGATSPRPARLWRRRLLPRPAHPRKTPASPRRKANCGERRTVCWREMDSNFQFRAK
jgi:hypothetical protein